MDLLARPLTALRHPLEPLSEEEIDLAATEPARRRKGRHR